MVVKIAVAGASGMAGGEVLRLLLAHPEIEIGALTGHSSVGHTIGEYHPHLLPLAERKIIPTTAENLADHDVVVFALPHGASGELTQELKNRGTDALLLDCGADHRLTDAYQWENYYGSPWHGAWEYGLPELLHAGEKTALSQREILHSAKQIAVPGCNVTAVTLAMQPGVAAGLIDPTDLNATLAVGYSGAGKSLQSHLLANEAIGQAKPYAVGGTHRHIPEIIQNFQVCGASEVNIAFTPILVPMTRGILAVVTAPLCGNANLVRAAWEEAYQSEELIKLLPKGIWPATGAVAGSGCATIQVDIDPRAGKVVAICAIDNLGKGTAAAMVQSMNLALGLPQTLGLPLIGVAP